MKYFYENENNEQIGPIDLEKLKLSKIKSSTLIWKEGMEDWSEAKKIEELKNLFIQPPPLPKNINQINSNNDINHKRKNIKKSSIWSPKGRMRRSEYFGYLFLFGLIIAGLNFLIENILEDIYVDNLFYIVAVFGLICILILLYLYLMIIIKRLHDMSFNGWLFFIGFIPIINLILLFWDGIEGPNRYGKDPKGRKSRTK